MIADEESIVLLSRMARFATQRQGVIANNLANANTPGYTRQKLEFEKELQAASRTGNLEDLYSVSAQPEDDLSSKARLDGNNVKVPKEMNEMMQNSVFFNLTNRVLATKMKILKDAIRSQ